MLGFEMANMTDSFKQS